MKIGNNFSQGKMNKASDYRFLEKGTYVDAKNILCTGVSENTAGVVKKIKGTLLKQTMSALTSDAKCIGLREFKGKYYAFMVDYDTSTTDTYIYEYDSLSDSLTLLTHIDIGSINGDGDYNYIRAIDVIGENDELLYFTDGINQPMKLNIDSLKSDSAHYSDATDMYVIKKPPFSEPSISPIRSADIYENYMKDKAFKFAYRYVYEDGEKSTLSFHSNIAYAPDSSYNEYMSSGFMTYYVYSNSLYRMDYLFQNPSEVSDLTEKLTSSYVKSMATSGDGRIVAMGMGYASGSSFNLYISYDYGNSFVLAETWTKNINHIDMSQDGKYIYVMVNDGYIYKSDNYGNTFNDGWTTTNFATNYMRNLACSADGKKIIALGGYNNGGTIQMYVYVSIDYGVTFTEKKMEVTSMDSVAISKNGRHMIAIGSSVGATACKLFYSNNDFDTVEETSNTGWGYNGIYWDSSISDDASIIYSVYINNGVDARVHLISDHDISTSSATAIHTFTGYDQGVYGYSNMAFSLSSDRSGELIAVSLGYYDVNTGIIGTSVDGGTTWVEVAGADSASAFNITGMSENTSGVYPNAYDSVNVTINSGNDHVIGAELFAIDVITGTHYLVKEYDYDKESISPDTDVTYSFKNAKSYRVLSESYVNMLYSNVPRSAGSLLIIDNILILADYIDGYDGQAVDYTIAEDSNPQEQSYWKDTATASDEHNYYIPDVALFEFVAGDILMLDMSSSYLDETIYKTIRYEFNDTYTLSQGLSLFATYLETIDYVSSVTATDMGVYYDFNIVLNSGYTIINRMPIVLANSSWSMKSGSNNEYGIIYYDDFNRSCAPLFDDGLITMSRYDGEVKDVVITLGVYDPPSWATKYKVCRKNPNLDFSVVKFEEYYILNGSIYLKTLASVSDGDTLIPVSNYRDVISYADSIDIIGVGEFDSNYFEEGSSSGKYIQLTGVTYDGLGMFDVLNSTDIYRSVTFYLVRKTEMQEMLYFETPGTYSITDGTHDTTVITIGGGDVYMVNNIEYNMIPGNLKITNLGRPSIDTDNFKQVDRYASVCWSEPFVESTNFNGLSSFNLSTSNYVDLKKEFGTIELIAEQNNKLLIVQHDRAGVGDISRVIYSQATGEQSVGLSDNFFEKYAYNAYNGKFGCQDYRSFTSHGFQNWFVDSKRRKILRLSADGLTPISDYLMKDYFNEEITNSLTDIIGFYDPENDLYFVGLQGSSSFKTLAFSEDNKGWVSLYDFIPDAADENGGKLFSVKGNKIYAHNDGSNCNFYGDQFNAYIKVLINEYPSSIKVWRTLETESDEAFDVLIQTDQEKQTDIGSDNFEKRESFYYAAIPMYDASQGTVTEGLDTNGLGTCNGTDDGGSAKLAFSNSLSKYWVKAGDTILIYDSPNLYNLGVVTSIDWTNKYIYTDYSGGGYSSVTVTNISNKLAISRKNSYIEGELLRGYYAEVELTHTGVGDINLFGINAEIEESKT